MFDTDEYREQVINEQHIGSTLIQEREQDRETYRNKLEAAADAEIQAMRPTEPEPIVTEPKEEEEGPGVLSEAKGVVVGGVRDGLQEVFESVEKGVNWLVTSGEHTDGPFNIFDLPEVEENKTTAGKLGRSVMAFVAPMFAAGAGLSKLGMASGMAKSMTAGAITDATIFAHEQRLSNLIQEYPNLANPITAYLAADPNDGEAETRFKAVLEGAMLGGSIELLLKGVKHLRGFRKAKAEGVADDVLESVNKQIQEIEGDVTKLQELKTTTEELRTTRLNKDITEGALEEGQEAIVKGDVIPDTKVKMGKEGLEIPEVKSLNEAVEPAEIVMEVEKAPWTKKNKQSAKDLKRAKRRTARKIKKGKLETVEEANLYNKRAEAYLDGIIKHTTLQSSPTVGSGIAGSVVGGATDIDRDGKLSMGDVVYGFMAGAGSYQFIKHFKNGKIKTDTVEWNELKTTRLEELDTLAKEIDNNLTSGSYGAKAQSRLKAHAATVKKLQDRIGKANNVEDLVVKVKSPIVQAEIERIGQPMLKLKSAEAKGAINKFINEIEVNGYSGNTHLDNKIFNFKRMGTPDDVNEMVSILANHLEGEFSKVTKGVQTHGMLEELAHDMNMSVEDMNKFFNSVKTGKNSFSAKVVASRNLVHSSNLELTRLEQVARASKTPADYVEWVAHLKKHAGILAQMKGIQTEAARALNSFRMTSTAGHSLEHVEKMLLEVGGEKNIERVMDKFNALGTTRQKNNFARTMGKNKTLSMALEWYYNALLSNPTTWLVNGISNSLVVGNTLLEKAVAVGASKLSGSNAHTLGELQAMTHGMLESFNDAFKFAGEAMKSGESSFDSMTKIEGESYHAWSSDTLDISKDSTMGKMVNTLGKIINVPGKVLLASDDAFKVVSHRMSLHESAWKEAFAELEAKGLKGQELQKELASLISAKVADPTEEMLSKAMDLARYNTFTNELGDLGKLTQKALSIAPAARFLLPFVRTPINIMKYAGSRVPIAPATLKALKSSDAVIREAAKAKLVVGAGLMATGAGLAFKGFLTGGGPSNNKHLRQAGWQPYSIKMGDSYYSINRVDPFGALLCVAADIYEVSQNTDDMTVMEELGAVAVSALQNSLSKTYVKGISDISALITEHEAGAFNRNLGKYAKNFGASFIVPSGVKAVEQSIHPEFSETMGFLEEVKSRLPHFSKDVPVKVDVFGEDIKLQGTAFNVFNPFKASEKTEDTTRQMFADLGVEFNDYQMGQIMEGVKLNSKQKRRYKQLAGKPLKKELDKMYKQDWFKKYSDVNKKAATKQLMSRARLYARYQLLEEFPELKNEVILAKQHKFEEQNKPPTIGVNN